MFFSLMEAFQFIYYYLGSSNTRLRNMGLLFCFKSYSLYYFSFLPVASHLKNIINHNTQ